MKLISPITSPGPKDASERSTSPRMFLKMSTRPLWTMNSESPGSFSRNSSSPPTRLRSSHAWRSTSASSEVSSANSRQRFSLPSSATQNASHGPGDHRKLSGVQDERRLDGLVRRHAQAVLLGPADHGAAQPGQLETPAAQQILGHRGQHTGGQRIDGLEQLLRERVVQAGALRASDRDGLPQRLEQQAPRRWIRAHLPDRFARQS